MQFERELASMIATVVKEYVGEQLGPLGIQFDALSARVNGLEAANSLRGTMDELKARLDRVERATKAGIVRLGAA